MSINFNKTNKSRNVPALSAVVLHLQAYLTQFMYLHVVLQHMLGYFLS